MNFIVAMLPGKASIVAGILRRLPAACGGRRIVVEYVAHGSAGTVVWSAGMVAWSAGTVIWSCVTIMESVETIAAISTPPGRGGVAVVRVSGPAAFAVAASLTGRKVDASQAGRFFHATFYAPSPGGSRGRVASGGKEGLFTPVDDGLVLVFAAPHSYTGEDAVELQCHGGSVSPRRLLEACLSAGARLARRGEFTQRAFLNGRMDLSAAEAVIDLIDAKTDRAADDAVARLGGSSAAAFEALYAAAIDLSSRVEHALDFDEDELPGGFIPGLARDVAALQAGIAAHLATAREGRLLREGALVVLAGPPNAGKSSLLNALLGEKRAIVSDVAGTTRDSIEEGIEIGGWPIRLVDTAGLRETDDAIEAEGVGRAETLLAEADVVLALDCDLPDALRIHAKCDLGPGEGLPVSALTGEGLPALRAAIADRLEKLSAKGCETSGADVTTRQKEQLQAAAAALARADLSELVVAANELRNAAEALGRMLGKVCSEDILDAVFSRFCVGK